MTAAMRALSDATMARRRGLASLLVLPLLAACGGTRVGGRDAAAAMAPLPARLLVATDGAAAIAAGDDPALVSRTAGTLTEAVVRGLRRLGIPAETATTDGPVPDAARLSLALHRVEEGGRAHRMALGAAGGPSRIEVMVRLHPEGAASGPHTLPAFHGSAHGPAHGGDRPGRLMPLGAALYAPGPVAIIGAAGAAVAAIRGRGLSQDVRDLAEAVVAYTAAFCGPDDGKPEAEPPPFDRESGLAVRRVEPPRRG